MRRILFPGILVFLLTLASAPVFGASLQETFKAAQKLQKEKKYDQAIAEYEKVVGLLVKAGKKPVAQKIQMNVGVLHFIQGRYPQAVEAYEKALGLHPKPQPVFRLKLLRNLASARHKSGEFALAAAIREKILADTALDPKLKPLLSAELAASLRAGEVHAQAVQAYHDALAAPSGAWSKEQQARLLISLGLSLSKLGRLDQALESLKQASELATETGQPRTVAESRSNLGVVYWDLGHYEAALKQLDAALGVEREHGLKENLGADLNNRGLVLKSSGNLDKALEPIQEAVRIAREQELPRDQAIALSNRALIQRLQGRPREARQDYLAALELYEQAAFKEGLAGCHLGLGKLSEVADKDFRKAHQHYLEAVRIYRELHNLGYLAEALNQLGRVLKTGIDKARTTRDLIFEDEPPVFLDLDSKEAAAKSGEAYTEALRLGRISGRREVIWSALQGLDFALKEQGELEAALEKYQEAVAIVVGIRFGGTDSSLLGDYLKDKEDLFDEAMEVCAALYTKTKDEKYLKLQMEFQEIYKNEVMKGATAAAGPEFEDSEKGKLFKGLTGVGGKRKKLAQAEGRINQALEKEKAGGVDTPEAKERRARLEKEAAQVRIESQKLDQTFESLLAQWKEKYPADTGLFDSAARVDLEEIRAGLTPDEALLQFFPLNDHLSVICVTKEEITAARVAIPYPDLAELIRDEFTYKQIELYGHDKKATQADERRYYKDCLQALSRLHNLLIKPVAGAIADKPRLVVVTSKYLSYVPFAALVQGFDDQGEPRFLVRDKTVSYLRLSFFENYLKARKATPVLDQARMLVVGNPEHYQLRGLLQPLEAAEEEARGVAGVASQAGLPEPTLLLTDQATEDAWRESSLGQNYSVFYFATHGVPYAEVLHDQRKYDGYLVKWRAKKEKLAGEGKDDEAAKYQRKIDQVGPFVDFCKATFTTKSPLNGFLYMSHSGQEKHDGIITLKEILEMPDSVFSQARLAVLSACNTAVTYSPKIGKELRAELESQEVSSDLAASGWSPGVDQVSLTDTFMKRNFTSVLGTLWFADDKAAGFISSNFFKGLSEHSPAESLRLAQLKYLDDPPLGESYTIVPKHPYYWAVAAIFGD